VIGLILLALALPCVAVTTGGDQRAALDAAGIERLCTEADLAAREALPAPGTAPRAGLASPTRAPWIVANGWRFMRHPDRRYAYDVPPGKAALAAAEAFAYGADAVLKIDASDARPLGEMLKFLKALPPVNPRVPSASLPIVSEFAVVDDGSAMTGEVMNLLARRNLLFEIVGESTPRFAINVKIGTPEYPREEAADPSAFALKIRRQLTDEQRALRVFGSEVVICRLTGDRGSARLHLINYGGREIQGLRIRVRGTYSRGEVYVAGAGRLDLEDQSTDGTFTEFTIPRLTAYAVVDLAGARP
jgi:hypothetical protein